MGDFFYSTIKAFDPLTDLFFKEFDSPQWCTITEKMHYPVDIYNEENGDIVIDIAAIGLDKKDINVNIDGDIIKVSYTKEKNEKEIKTIQKSISRKSFNYSWKISSKFDVNKMTATLDKGLLKIVIPVSQEKVAKKIEIQ